MREIHSSYIRFASLENTKDAKIGVGGGFRVSRELEVSTGLGVRIASKWYGISRE